MKVVKREPYQLILILLLVGIYIPLNSQSTLDYYIPFPAQDLHTSQVSVSGTASNRLQDYVSYQVSIVSNSDGTTFYYDHWEDGYDAFTGGTPDQVSTDTFTTNAGDVTVLESNDENGITPRNTPCGPYDINCPVPVSPRGTAIYYDGGDRIISSAALAVSINFWPLICSGDCATAGTGTTTPGTVMGGAAEVLPTLSLSTDYEIPVGENVDQNFIFEYAGLFILATEDGTTVNVDGVNYSLDMGENLLIDGGVDAGISVTSDKNILVHEYTGDINATYETRVYLMWPRDKWSDSYYNPVGTRAADPTWIWIYNPHATTLSVKVATFTSGITNVNVPPGGVNTYVMSDGDGANVYSTDGRDFYAVTTTDSDANNTAFDWGFTLIPERNLTSEVIVGFGDGSFGTGNASPLWVSAESATTIYVNWDGREGDCDTPGNNDDSYTVSAFQSTTLFDSDSDQTGARVFTCDGTKIAVAWGEDPALASTALDLDMGTVIIPISTGVEVTKTAALFSDGGVPGKADIGDEIEWTISVFNTGAAPVSTVVLEDPLPANTDYVANTGTWERIKTSGTTSGAIADEMSGTAYPFDDDGIVNAIDNGYDIGTMEIGETIVITFRVSVNSTSSSTIENNATITSNSGTATANASAEIPVPAPPVASDNCGLEGAINTDLEIDVLANDADPFGDDITFTGFTAPSVDATTITIAGEGTFTYSVFTKKVTFSPENGFTGAITTTSYQICDTEGLCDTADICITYNAVDENGCTPTQTWTATSTGNGDSQTNNGEVGDPDFALGSPNGAGAELGKDADPAKMGLITIDLTDTVPEDGIISLFLASKDGTATGVSVTTSLNGSSFSDEQFFNFSINQNDGFDEIFYTINQVGGVRYVRILQASEDKESIVDAVSYELFECVDNCVLPTVRVDIDGNGAAVFDEVGTTNPTGALGNPDISASGGTWAKIDQDESNPEYLILDLGTQIPTGLSVDLYLSTDDGNAATVQVQQSSDGTTFSNLQSYNISAGIKAGDGDVIIQTYTASGGSFRYLRFTRADSGGKPAIDGVVYDIFECLEGTPTAMDDAASATACNAVYIDVQDNDTDPFLNPLTTTIVSSPSNGTAIVEANGSIAYASNSGYTGTDMLTYRITNSFGLYDEATVVITVNNDPDGNCAVGQTFVTIGNGYGEAVQTNTSIADAEAALGTPDLTAAGNDAGLNDNADVLVVDMGTTVAQGDTVTIYHYTDNNFATAGGAVAASATTSGYSGSQNLTYTANDAIHILKYEVTQAAGARYFRFTHTGENIFIDALVRDRNTCVTDCSTGSFIDTDSGNGVSQTNTGVDDPDFALGTPNHEGAKVTRNNADILTINLGKVIPQGGLVYLYLGTNGGGTSTFQVTGSTSGTTGFSDAQNISVTNIAQPSYVQKVYNVNQSGGIQYIRMVITNDDQDGWVDAVGFDYAVCSSATPDAVDDVAYTSEDTPITIDVTDNDTIPQGSALIPTIVTQPPSGLAVVNMDGTISFYPNPEVTTAQTFTYEICAVYCSMLCDTATVTVNIIDDVCPAGERPGYVTDYADVVTAENSTSDPTFSLGEPTDPTVYTKIDNDADYLVLHLPHEIPIGGVIKLHIGTDDGNAAQLYVQSTLTSTNYSSGTGFFNPQTYNTTVQLDGASPEDVVDYTVTTSSIRYLRFTRVSGAGNPSVVGIEYSGNYGACEPYLQLAIAPDNSCQGLDNGSIDLSPSSGTSPYSYVWSNGATTQDISGLAPGTYYVTVTDASTDERVTVATIGEDPNPTAIAGSNTPVCQNQDVNLTETGIGGTGSAGETWAWVGPASFNSTLENPSIVGAPLSAAGVYSVLVTNSFGCTASSSTTVVVNSAPSCNITGATSICSSSQDEVYSAPSGMTTYLWEITSGDATIDGATGNQTVTIDAGSNDFTIQLTTTDANSCSTVCTQDIIINPLPTLAATSSNPTTCGGNDGSIGLTLTNVPDGMYTINYMDGVPSAQTFTNVNVSSGSATISSLSAGTYNDLTITVSGCTSTEDVDITLTDPVNTATANTAALLLCDDNTDGFADFTLSEADATVLGGQMGMNLTYHISQTDAENDANALNSPFTNTLNPQTIYARVEDSNGCYAISQVTLATTHDGINALAALNITGTTNDPNPFPTGTFTGGYFHVFPATQSTSYNYNFTFDNSYIPEGFIIDPDWGGMGTMSYIKNDANSLSSTSISIHNRITEYHDFNSGSIANASGEVYQVYGRGHFSFNGYEADSMSTIQPDRTLTFDFTGLANGYLPGGTFISFVDNDGMFSLDNGEYLLATAALTSGGSTPWMTPQDSTIHAPFHGHGEYEAAGQPANSYYFDGPESSVGQNPAILYRITENLNSITINSLTGYAEGSVGMKLMAPIVAFDLTSTTTDPTTCSGTDGAIDLTVTGGTPTISYNWSPGGSIMQDVTGLTEGTYMVTVTDGKGCIDTLSSILTDPTPPSCLITGNLTVDENATGTIYSAPAGMTSYLWSITGNGSISGANNLQTVSIDAGANGSFTLTLMITDGNSCDATCMQVVNINPINDPPVADNDTTSTNEDTPVTLNILLDDTDPDGDLNGDSIRVITYFMHGDTSMVGDSMITYVPNLNFYGTDSLQYEVCDTSSLGSLCDTAWVFITVNPVNDPPVAMDDATSTPEDTPVMVNVTTNDDDPLDPLGNIDPTTVDTIMGGSPVNGTIVIDPLTGVITYTPDPGYNGLDSLEYVVCDDGNPLPAQCDTAKVVINVGAVNDPPVALLDRDTTNEDTPVYVDVQVNDSDPDGDDLTTLEIILMPDDGTAIITNLDSILYTPDPSFVGNDTLTYRVCDAGGLCDTAYVYLVIELVNSPPTMGNEIVFTPQDSILKDIDLVDNNTDPDGDPLTINPPITSNQGGVVTDNLDGTIDYTPPGGFTGKDTLIYTVCDPSLACVTDTLFITVGGCVTVNTAVYLEGSWEETNMYTKLNNLGYLPGQKPSTFFGIFTTAGQPYNRAPWNYTGTEGTTMDYMVSGIPDAGYPTTAVDWVLVSLRTGSHDSTMVCQRAGLLHQDGTITFESGFDCCDLNPFQQYYLVIEHRNHLIVMSHQPVSVTNDTIAYDFRIQQSYTNLFGFSQKEIKPGVFVMYGGNGEQINSGSSDTDINVGDKSTWLDENGDHSSYYFQDFDMNGDSNVQDKNLWLRNNGKFSDVPRN